MKRRIEPERESAVELLARLSVEEIEQQLAERESALAEIVAKHRREIDALAVLLKAARIARDGKPAKGAKKRRGPAMQAAANGKPENPNRLRIADWLGSHPPAAVRDIARALDLPPGPVSRLVNHEWFCRVAGDDDEELIALARAG